MSSPSVTLTSHLVSLSTVRPYTAATQHDFLTRAGKGTLSSDLLSLYLSQDRIYAAHGYTRFLGHILSSLPFSSLHSLSSPQEKFNWTIVKVLSGALENVVREVGFFGDVADKFGLKLEGWRERKATRDYTAEMARVVANGTWKDGLIFLWAMEKVYLDAWKYVESVTSPESDTGPTSEAIAWLVSNWTNAEFVDFVDNLGNIVNNLGIQPGSEEWTRAGQIWSRVVELEEQFWPSGEDEISVLRLQA